jgi:hypothetical protein
MKKWRCLDEICKYTYVEYKVEDIDFTDNEEKIIDFYNSGEDDHPLEDYLNFS